MNNVPSGQGLQFQSNKQLRMISILPGRLLIRSVKVADAWQQEHYQQELFLISALLLHFRM